LALSFAASNLCSNSSILKVGSSAQFLRDVFGNGVNDYINDNNSIDAQYKTSMKEVFAAGDDTENTI
jgi:thioredoxin reductase